MQYIDREIRNYRFPNCPQLAECFGISRRSIQRDIDFMRDQLMAPIDFDRRRNGYRYSQLWAFDPSLVLARRSLDPPVVQADGQVPGIECSCPGDLASPIAPALNDLRGIRVASPIYDIPALDHPDSGEFEKMPLAFLEQAISQRRKVRMTYIASVDSDFTERTVRPYRLHYDRSSEYWYLIAFCEYRQEGRSFAVRRIFNPRLTSDTFMPPSLFSILGFIDSVFHHHRSSFPVDISIRFTPTQSRWIRLRRWHQSQQIEEHDNGSLTLKLTVGALGPVKRWVMHFGAHAEVLEPEKLRAMIRQELQKMDSVYGE